MKRRSSVPKSVERTSDERTTPSSVPPTNNELPSACRRRACCFGAEEVAVHRGSDDAAPALLQQLEVHVSIRRRSSCAAALRLHRALRFHRALRSQRALRLLRVLRLCSSCSACSGRVLCVLCALCDCALGALLPARAPLLLRPRAVLFVRLCSAIATSTSVDKKDDDEVSVSFVLYRCTGILFKV